jgi:methylglyoxal synthase
MKEFIMYNKETLKNFRITGTNTTIQMVKTLIGAGANFGPACTSGPLGGDAQIAAQVAYEDIGCGLRVA